MKIKALFNMNTFSFSIPMNNMGYSKAFAVLFSIILLASFAAPQFLYAMYLTPIQIIDTTGDDTHALDQTFRIASDLNDNVYVGGKNSHNVFKITPEGEITEIIDRAGPDRLIPNPNAADNLVQPEGIAVDGNGNVYVAGFASRNVFKIDNPGTCSTGPPNTCTFTEILRDPGHTMRGISVDGNGNVYVAAGGGANNPVYRIANPVGCSVTGTPCVITEIKHFAPFSPQDIEVDSAGNIYVSDFNGNNVFRIATPGTCDVSGTACTETKIIDSSGDGTNALNIANGITVDSNDNVYVANQNNPGVFKINTPGTCDVSGTACTITEIIDSTGDGMGNTMTAADNVDVDDNDNIYVTGLSSNDNAFQIINPVNCSTAGTPTTCIITELIDGTGDGTNALDQPRDIAVDSIGNAFVTGFSTDNAFKIPLDRSSVTGIAFVDGACEVNLASGSLGFNPGDPISNGVDVGTGEISEVLSNNGNLQSVTSVFGTDWTDGGALKVMDASHTRVSTTSNPDITTKANLGNSIGSANSLGTILPQTSITSYWDVEIVMDAGALDYDGPAVQTITVDFACL